MTTVETETDRIEDLLKADANGHLSPEDKEWLRDPENLDDVFVVLKVLYAKIKSQVDIADNNLSNHARYEDGEWLRKVRHLEACLRPRLVEFEALYAAQRRSDLRSAIRRHRAALIAADGEPEAYDLMLWQTVDGDE